MENVRVREGACHQVRAWDLGHNQNFWIKVKSQTRTLLCRSTQELWGKYSVKSAIIRSQLDTLDRMQGGEVS